MTESAELPSITESAGLPERPPRTPRIWWLTALVLLGFALATDISGVFYASITPHSHLSPTDLFADVGSVSAVAGAIAAWVGVMVSRRHGSSTDESLQAKHELDIVEIERRYEHVIDSQVRRSESELRARDRDFVMTIANMMAEGMLHPEQANQLLKTMPGYASASAAKDDEASVARAVDEALSAGQEDDGEPTSRN